MRKTLLRLFAVTIAASGLAACASEPMTPQEATRWIAAYTPEQIDMASRIRIEATDSLLARLDTLRPLEKAFRFSPLPICAWTATLWAKNTPPRQAARRA